MICSLRTPKQHGQMSDQAFLLRSYEQKNIHSHRTGRIVVLCTAVSMMKQMLLSTAGTASWALALSATH